MEFMDAATARKMAKEGWDAKVKAKEEDILRRLEKTILEGEKDAIIICAQYESVEDYAMRELVPMLKKKGYKVEKNCQDIRIEW